MNNINPNENESFEKMKKADDGNTNEDKNNVTEVQTLPRIMIPRVNPLSRNASPPYPPNFMMNPMPYPPNPMMNNEYVGKPFMNDMNNPYHQMSMGPLGSYNYFNPIMGYDPHFRNINPFQNNFIMPQNPVMFNTNRIPLTNAPFQAPQHLYKQNAHEVATPKETTKSEDKEPVKKLKRRKNKAFKYKGRYVCVICADKAGMLKKNSDEDIELLNINGNNTNSLDQCLNLPDDNHIPFSFSTSGHLTRHLRLHSGVKDHVCPEESCGKRFGRKDNMRQHYKIHLRKK